MTQGTISQAAPNSAIFDSPEGMVVYALLLIVGWLLIRDFLKDRLIWRMVDASREADKSQALALRAVEVSLSRVESAVGVQQVKRLIEKGELYTGVLPEGETK